MKDIENGACSEESSRESSAEELKIDGKLIDELEDLCDENILYAISAALVLLAARLSRRWTSLRMRC